MIEIDNGKRDTIALVVLTHETSQGDIDYTLRDTAGIISCIHSSEERINGLLKKSYMS